MKKIPLDQPQAPGLQRRQVTSWWWCPRTFVVPACKEKVALIRKDRISFLSSHSETGVLHCLWVPDPELIFLTAVKQAAQTWNRHITIDPVTFPQQSPFPEKLRARKQQRKVDTLSHYVEICWQNSAESRKKGFFCAKLESCGQTGCFFCFHFQPFHSPSVFSRSL